jgi:hypothetical protein
MDIARNITMASQTLQVRTKGNHSFARIRTERTSRHTQNSDESAVHFRNLGVRFSGHLLSNSEPAHGSAVLFRASERQTMRRGFHKDREVWRGCAAARSDTLELCEPARSKSQKSCSLGRFPESFKKKLRGIRIPFFS